MIKKAPTRSKFFKSFLTKACLGSVKKHSNKNTTHMIEEILIGSLSTVGVGFL